MKGTNYNFANMMFFIPYILLEVPANAILIRFTKPSQWISLIVTAWGIVMTCSGFVQNWGGLVGCRVLLGVFESVMCFLLITFEYILTFEGPASSPAPSSFSASGTLHT